MPSERCPACGFEPVGVLDGYCAVCWKGFQRAERANAAELQADRDRWRDLVRGLVEAAERWGAGSDAFDRARAALAED